MAKSKTSIKQVFTTIIWPRRNIVGLGLLFIIINRLAGLVLPGASKYLMDDVIVNKDVDKLIFVIAAVVGAIVLQAITSFSLTKILSVEAHNLIAELRVKVQKHILQLPISFFDNAKSGELVSRIMNDVEGVRNLVGTGLVQLIGGVLTSFVSLFLLINISPMMTLYTLTPMAIFGFISMKAFGKIRPIFKERGVINAEVVGRLNETLGGIRVVKGYYAEEQEIASFAKGANRLFENVSKSLTATSLVTSSATLLLGMASAGILGIGGYMIIEDALTFGEFLAFTLYLGFLVAPMVQMGNIGSQLTEAFAGLDRMDEVLSMPTENSDPQRTNVLAEVKGDLYFNKVNFSYEEGTPILKNVSFDAPAGSVTALVGSSGSGKSTIANLVASFTSPNSGSITIDGVELRSVTYASYRSRLGVVLQDEFLFEGSIRDNILFPNPKASEEELAHAIRAAHVDEFTDRFAEGIETKIGERGVKLSGGQKQRVAIARAILANPRVLILDEATSNLDNQSEAYIQESLKTLMQGRTTFIIAHRLSTIKQADQILVVEQGEIVERGTHEELLTKKERYHELFTYQARI